MSRPRAFSTKFLDTFSTCCKIRQNPPHKMALFTHSQLRNIGKRVAQQKRAAYASTVLDEANRTLLAQRKQYDIFLCHSKLDEDEVLGLKETFSDLGYAVYVDWIEDKQLDRSKVSKQTADVLRTRMRDSRSLFYATSENAGTSVWMPWELGYFDGFKQRVAIIPVSETEKGDDFQGREYCELYPYIVQNGTAVYVHRNRTTYVGLARWMDGATI